MASPSPIMVAAGSRALTPRSICLASASAAWSAMTWRKTSASDTPANAPSLAPSSLRASASSCCTVWIARSSPDLRSPSAPERSAALVARSSSPAWSCRAVNGVRSSCAASAMKSRCTCSVARRRPSSSLSETTSGRASSGTPLSVKGSSASGVRVRTERARSVSGRSSRLTISQISSAMRGNRTMNGVSVRNAAVAASRARTLVGWATAMVSPRYCRAYTRQVSSLVRSVANPRRAISGRGRCGREE